MQLFFSILFVISDPFIQTMGLHLHKAQKAIKEFDRSMADLFMVHRQMHLGSNRLKFLLGNRSVFIS